MKLFFGILMSVVFVSAAVAQEKTTDGSEKGKLTRIYKGQLKAEVQWKAIEYVPVGTALVFTSHKDESCEGRVVDIAKNMTKVDLTGCEIISDLKVGQAVAISEFPKEAPRAEAKRQDSPSDQDESSPGFFRKPLRVGLGVFYYSANQLKFNSVRTSTNGTQDSTFGSASYTTQGAGGLQGEIAMIEPQSWGFNAGFTVEGRRELTNGESTVAGVSAGTNTSETTVLRYGTVYGNMLYRWDNFYIPFGLNFSIPAVDNPSILLRDTRGTVGMQFGLGYMLSEHFTIYSDIRVVGFAAPSNARTSTTSVEGGYGTLAGLDLGLKGYLF